MKFGLHVSAAGGVFNAPVNAAQFGCETFQFFSRSPRGGAAPKLDKVLVDQFLANCKSLGYNDWYIHAPYYVNFASADNRTFHSSIAIIRDELARASLLHTKAIMVHIGSSKDLERDEALERVVKGLTEVLKDYKGTAQFLIEISAGAGNVIGDTFDEVAFMIKKVQPKTKSRIGVCFDTAHAFASGYDLRTATDVKKTFTAFDNIIGLDRLTLIHGNDSMVDFNAKKDRHWHIGEGKIGLEGFRAIINHPKLKNIDMIMETPGDDKDSLRNITTVKKLRKK